ncbi:DUF1671-domain-containing protein [Coemansia reversa NRRL 1564]|uniref:DUF1671-domain-containing protein n=1 Tax=Coemansia reversa (strain ATCC 12441 / NRRL 1564) TaxID=763665 RepID=A0A2G5B968_COERN|nr:DUF1671-domain-containing protein [Coemansia reversa NRRL 1564]|eukprot:PIA15559.1 DUF1671-domain-containing protein [Coemansia reversa NRRL 1564]
MTHQQAIGLGDVIDLTSDSSSSSNNNNTKASSDRRSRRKGAGGLQALGALFHRPSHSTLRIAQLEYAHGIGSSSVVLCSGETQLFCSTPADRRWACGYRNCQMLISALISRQTHSVDTGSGNLLLCGHVPDVDALQQMLELAWREGYDPEGAVQLRHRVVGTRKWIGATEVYCIMAHLGAATRIVDFPRPSARDGSHPLLFAWVLDYYTAPATTPPAGSDTGVCLTSRAPLYLQHQGHSRTIVGVEITETATFLLVLDPNARPNRDANNRFSISAFRLSLSSTRHATQYQILYVDETHPATTPISKQVTSVRVS